MIEIKFQAAFVRGKSALAGVWHFIAKGMQNLFRTFNSSSEIIRFAVITSGMRAMAQTI